MTSPDVSEKRLPCLGQRPTYRRRLDVVRPSRGASRSARFLRRRDPVPHDPAPSFSDLAALPQWVLLDESIIAQVACLVSLLHFRRHIDMTIGGEALRSLCQNVGEHNLDLACAAPLPPEALLADVESRLPPPELMHDTGRTLMAKSLPRIMTSIYREAAGDPLMLALADLATEIVLTGKSQPQGVAEQ